MQLFNDILRHILLSNIMLDCVRPVTPEVGESRGEVRFQIGGLLRELSTVQAATFSLFCANRHRWNLNPFCKE